MMDLSSIGTWATILAPVLGGAYTTFRIISSNLAKKKKRLQFLEMRINQLNEELEALKEDLEKEMKHTKESYKTEIGFLSQKIGELREEINAQNTQIVTLLTGLIGKD